MSSHPQTKLKRMLCPLFAIIALPILVSMGRPSYSDKFGQGPVFRWALQGQGEDLRRNESRFEGLSNKGTCH